MSVQTATNTIGSLLTEEFQKWREGDGIFSPVRLSVDPEGFFVYEEPLQQSLIGEAKARTYDLILVSDCSSGRIRRCRHLDRLMEQLSFESVTSYEDNYLCLVFRQHSQESAVHYFVSPTYTYFLHSNPKVIEKWCSHVNALSFNQQHINGDMFCYLRKVRCQLLFESAGHLVKCSEITRLMGLPRDQEKVLEGVLGKIGLLEESGTEVSKSKLTEQLMWLIYMELCPRLDLDKIFLGLLAVEKSQVEFLSYSSLLQFINNTQWDPRVNDQLIQKLKVRSLKEMFKSISITPTADQTLSLNDFYKYLHSSLNSIVTPGELKCPRAMSHPLCNYFINSSHNTYLTGNQLKSNSTVEMYIQALLLGARCIELDCWDSSTGEPVITHGNTLCSKISFEEVIKAIAEFAFLKSDTPVILSFENHCSKTQQQLMARFCVKYLGSTLCTLLPSHPTNPGVKLPSPSDLRGKILIKNKRVLECVPPPPSSINKVELKKLRNANITPEIVVNKNIPEEWDGTIEVDMELSGLVNYVEPVKFKSFDESLEKERNCEMSSFSEVRGLVLLQHEGAKFIRYNSTHTSRIYPAASRISSSNYMPQIYWNVGCQMVALNYQTPDLPMQINQAKFELAGNCGYLLKPDILRVEKSDRNVLEPFTQTPPEHYIPTNCGIRVVSAHFLGPVQCELMVQAEVFGLPADTHRRNRDNTTRFTNYNGMRAMWDEEKWIRFEGIFSQELALLKINIMDEASNIIAHRILPLSHLQNGYRHIYMRDRYNLPLGLASLFVQVKMEDFVADGLEGYANVLKNPEQLARGGQKVVVTRLESGAFKREAIQSMLVGEEEVQELQDIISGIEKRPATFAHNKVHKPLLKSTYSLSVNLDDGYPDQQSPKRPTTPTSFTSSFDYDNVPRPRKNVLEPQAISSEFIPSIKSIKDREQIIPQSVEAIIGTNKSIICKQDKQRKEQAANSRAYLNQIESFEHERGKHLKDIRSNYDKEIQKVDKALARKIPEDERTKLQGQKDRLLDMKDLKLSGVSEQATRDIEHIRCRQEREEAKMELDSNREVKLLAIPLLKAAHQNQRQQILEKVHEFEKKSVEKEIEVKKLDIINDLLSKTGTLCSQKATQATVKVFMHHQTTEFERLQSQETNMFERESNNILKQLEHDVKELELKFEQFDS